MISSTCAIERVGPKDAKRIAQNILAIMPVNQGHTMLSELDMTMQQMMFDLAEERITFQEYSTFLTEGAP